MVSPPSFEVRKVKRRGISPSACLRSFRTSFTESMSRPPENQSHRHSTTSGNAAFMSFAEPIISSLVTPTIGTMIFGLPWPMVRLRICRVLLIYAPVCRSGRNCRVLLFLSIISEIFGYSYSIFILHRAILVTSVEIIKCNRSGFARRCT